MQPSQFLSEAGSGVFKVLGTPPAGYYGSSVSDGRNGDMMAENENPLAAKWCKGTRLYHDDWGYGQIISTESREGEYVITVQFESGSRKQFMPAYQSHSLMIVHD